eukprot:TRINITY_DN8977_c0_g1_i5.p2 TRINITY_DN8977_c0_g1~~TRINITY_DN8977_c0_g1_i5.p2  ORF type:complete len:125 (-),score=34.24 TRINITY_DN8977_c0_g1_i5:132-458(-)
MAASALQQAPLAEQPVWQAAEPLTVNVDYDVPSHSSADVIKVAKSSGQGASFMAASALPQAPLAEQAVWQAAEPVMVNVDYDVPSHSVHGCLCVATSSTGRSTSLASG